MKSMSILALLALTSPVLAEELTDTSSRTPLGAITWLPTPFGPDAAPVMGDFSKGRHVTLVRFPAGMKTPVHIHSGDYTGIVVTGTARHYAPGHPETEIDLVPGSFWSMPGNLPHISECLPGADCIFALFQDTPFDFVAHE